MKLAILILIFSQALFCQVQTRHGGVNPYSGGNSVGGGGEMWMQFEKGKPYKQYRVVARTVQGNDTTRWQSDTITEFVELWAQYKAECYADSDWDGAIGLWGDGSLHRGYGHYIHRRPTAEGFLNWLSDGKAKK